MHRFPIEQAKVQRPSIRTGTLHRARLVRWLENHVNRRILLVTAEAGYGKTTLLADWACRTAARVFWVRLEQGDGDWASFVNYLVASGREVDREFAPTTSVLLDELAGGANNRPIIAATLRQELAAYCAAGRVAIVLDDFHAVDTVKDIRQFLSDLILEAPPGLSFIIASRRRSGLPLSRLRAMGEVADLRVSDLRFRPSETEELFRDTFQQPIEPDLLQDVARRTEGWVASLQLVLAAIRGRSREDARALVRGMTGGRGDLYDYLAEEVVGDLPRNVQSFLMRTSVLRSMTLEGAQIVTGLSDQEVTAMLERIRRLNLLSEETTDTADGGFSQARFHPLVREFLESRLAQEEGAELVIRLHRELAERSERSDWRTAAYHYEAIAATSDVQRVLIDNAATIMARGEFDAAKAHVDRLDPAATDPVMDLFVSRVELDEGRVDSAVERARSTVRALAGAPGDLQGLALLTLAAALMTRGDIAATVEAARDAMSSIEEPRLAAVVRATLATIEATQAGRLDEYQELLADMEVEQRRAREYHYLGVTLLNLGVAARERGQAAMAKRCANEASELLVGGARSTELVGAKILRGWAAAHLGDWANASADIVETVDSATGPAYLQCVTEAAEVWVRYGDIPTTERLIAGAKSAGPRMAFPTTLLLLVELELACRTRDAGRGEDAAAALRHVPAAVLIAYQARKRYLLARAAATFEPATALAMVDDAIRFAQHQRANAIEQSARLLRASLLPKDRMVAELLAVARADPAFVTAHAELFAARLVDLSDEATDLVLSQVRRYPQRWRDALRSALSSAPSQIVASLLSEIGEPSDIQLLDDCSRMAKDRRAWRGYVLQLAHRSARRILLEDLGRVRLRLATDDASDLPARPKALELLSFLVTRPDMAATKDEVIDALWPDADPAAGTNSLNQTLYSLRRVFEPAYEERLTPGYIQHVSEMIWLDADLVSSRSRRCQTLIARIATSPTELDLEALASEYRAKFALDFSYMDWAAPYRDLLHAGFLHSMETGLEARQRAGELQHSVSLARRVLEVDATAEAIERLLMRGYYHLRADGALREQYAHYAAALRADLGLEPPTLRDLIVSDFRPEADT